MGTAVAKPELEKSKAVAEFNPTQTRMKLGALKGAVGHARKIKDWEALDRAIDEVIAEQRKFIAFWNGNVTPGGKGGDRKSKNHGPNSATVISAAAATKQTGISKQQVNRWLTRLEDEPAYREILHESAHAPMWALKDKIRGTTGTGENEWFTPAEYVALARSVLGGIDLDPASSDKAQEIIDADRYFTKADDGLKQEWRGRVWLNPPYAQPLIADFVSKMVSERKAGRVTAGVMLTHNYTDTSWFHEAAAIADSICFTRGRIKFYEPDGEIAAPTQGQAFFYFGSKTARFASVFADIGFVALPWRNQA
jgi:phage N-6-adenine-methyltransferase